MNLCLGNEHFSNHFKNNSLLLLLLYVFFFFNKRSSFASFLQTHAYLLSWWFSVLWVYKGKCLWYRGICALGPVQRQWDGVKVSAPSNRLLVPRSGRIVWLQGAHLALSWHQFNGICLLRDPGLSHWTAQFPSWKIEMPCEVGKFRCTKEKQLAVEMFCTCFLSQHAFLFSIYCLHLPGCSVWKDLSPGHQSHGALEKGAGWVRL